MLINFVLENLQKIFKPIYDRSAILQNIDWLIFINILLVIISSITANSDTIGYFALFSVILTIIKLFTKTGESLSLNFSDKMLLLYFLFVLISVSGSTLFYLSLKGFLKTLTYLGFYLSVVYFLKDNRDKIKWFFVVLAISASYETVFAILQNYGAVEEISGWQDVSHLNPEEIMTRVYGTLKPYNPNLFGGYMLSIIPAFITLPFINNRFLIPALIGGILSSVALVCTGCRGAYIGFFFELIFLAVLTYKFLKPVYKKVYTYVVSLFSFLIFGAIVATASLRARVFSIFAMRSDSSNSFRFNVYNSCLSMLKDNWLLGIGCGNQNFREIYGLYMRTGFDALSAYNIYLEIAVESGIFALLSFAGFIVSNIIKALRVIYNTKSIEKVYVIAALISIVGMLTHGIVDTVFFRPQIQFVFWIMVGTIRVIGE